MGVKEMCVIANAETCVIARYSEAIHLQKSWIASEYLAMTHVSQNDARFWDLIPIRKCRQNRQQTYKNIIKLNIEPNSCHDIVALAAMNDFAGLPENPTRRQQHKEA
jgi:hypothetical protein